ncbi:hypothetical protein TELCIR_11018 [Teladorsagia circumcincta]|uniref:Uncharacterized protein n=1 Tax=Teladorsagia circumcincta TaxID=45464 RepID=A0A2G9UAK9_TELCI|nr:hypothetical protein TELCIR_11018 [Teladorsagia circumcincta]
MTISLQVRSLTKVLLDKYGVAVEPETSLNLSWEKYISKFFSGQIEVDNEGNVSLNENDPLLHDKILKKWTIDALEAPIGSGFDSSFDSTDSTTVNSLDDRQDGQRSRSDEDVIGLSMFHIYEVDKSKVGTSGWSQYNHSEQLGFSVYVDQSGGASHRGSESRMPFDRFSKVSRSFHGVTKETAFFDHACDDCSDLAGADLASVEPVISVAITDTSSSGGFEAVNKPVADTESFCASEKFL